MVESQPASFTMRATPRRILKSILVITLMGFVLTHMNMMLASDETGIPDDQSLYQQQDSILPGMRDNHLAASLHSNATNATKHSFDKSKGVAALTAKLPDPPRGDNATFIKDFMTRINSEQKVHNLDKFDLRSGEETVVIVVQVHNRPEYLRHLLNSLRQAHNIDKTLLIFSQDFYSVEVNKVIATVDFCPYMQIFFPFPVQIYTHQFPGDDPKDCPRDAKKDAAMKLKCINAAHPDKYGHYRESKYTQTKHHWFWKINHIFDYVAVMQHHTGPVLLIEEDHYLAEDFIHVLHQMVNLGKESCPDCAILTLGTYDKSPTYTSNSAKVEITDWVSNKHNMGMALSKKVWQKIIKCAEAFCRFDDYNWDWSLQFTSMSCIKGRLKVMLMKSPRVFHIGECGMHKKGKNCNTQDKVKQLETLLTQNKRFLYPERLTILGYPRSLARMPKPNGGWGDVRDHELCLSFTQEHTHR